MIAIDTSALMAVLRDEPDALRVIDALATTGDLAISAATLADALITADACGLGAAMRRMVEGLGLIVLPLTAAAATRVAEAQRRWREDGLTFGGAVAYDLAQQQGCALVHADPALERTDVVRG